MGTTQRSSGSAKLMALGFSAVLAGCATSPWHERLMTPEELVVANCQSLQQEDARMQDNIRHLNEASGTSSAGSILLAVLEGVAGAKTGQSNNQASTNHASMADKSQAKARDLEDRRSLVQKLRQRKGCA